MRDIGKGRIEIPIGMRPWPQEMRVAEILASRVHEVEFLVKGTVKTADILLDGVEFEIKSPKTDKANSLEHIIKSALEQSPNIIIDISRMRRANNIQIRRFLVTQARVRKRIKKMLFITKDGQVIDIMMSVR